MRRHVKASSAGSTKRRGSRIGLIAVVVAALFLVPTSQAFGFANVTVVKAGSGAAASTVTSNPAGIDCGGACGPHQFLSALSLTATPASGYFFAGWSGVACEGGAQSNPCALPLTPIDRTATATFNPLPGPPRAATGGVSPGREEWLRSLEGAVDPEEFKVSECFFEYGTTTAYGTKTPCVEPDAAELDSASTIAESVHAETEPLEANITYHYRLVASNLGGVSRGEDRTFTAGAAPQDTCPNAARRSEQGIGTLLLPACMALEMVSPPGKAGSPAATPNVSATGSRVTFVSRAVLGENPGGLLTAGGATYVASRGSSGWASQSTVPDRGFYKEWEQERFRSFTPDFSRWFGMGATRPQLQQGIGQAFEAGLGGFFSLLSQALEPLSFQGASNFVVGKAQFQGASADHSHLYFRAGERASYFSGDPNLTLSGTGAEPANVYLARYGAGGQPVLELLSRDRMGKVWGGNCGARLGGIGSAVSGSAPNGERNQGAVSPDGSRTYFSARAAQSQSGVVACNESNKLRILERLETPSGPQIFPLFSSECSRAAPEVCSSADGDDLYQGASVDGSRVYFTTNRQLASSDLDGSGTGCSVLVAIAGCDLYLYDRTRPAGERLVQVSAGEEVPGEHEVGKEAKVYNGITAISGDGSHVYFVAAGVLTHSSNSQGATAQAGRPNLYVWDADSEDTAFVGTLRPFAGPTNPGDAIVSSDGGRGLWGGQGTWRNNAYPVPATGQENGVEVGGDGHILVFESRAELTGADRDGSHLDVYRYDAGAPSSLQCLSCAPGSSASRPDEAPFDVDDRGEEFPPGTDFAEVRRWVSEDGEEVGFMTPQALLPGDADGAKDAYLWRQGALARLPGAPFGGAKAIARDDGPFLSHDGSTVAFATSTPLLPSDGDSTGDVYVARVDGGYPNPLAPNPCEPGDPTKACQQAAPPPPPPSAASEAAGPGNPPRFHSCPKGKIRRHGRCVPRKRRHATKHHRTRQIDSDRRAAK